MKQTLLWILLFVISADGHAQVKQTTYASQFWSAYYPQIRFSKHWGLWSDIELHSKDGSFDKISQTGYRLAGTYYVTDNCKITAGYGYTNYYPGDTHKYISQPEHYGWQQLQWYTYFRKKRLMQWLRLEEKFKRNIIDDYTLADDYTFNYRARYNFLYRLPLSSKGIVAHSLSAVLGDELYISFGKSVTHYFDQNRAFAGISYYVNSHDNLVFGYMNSFQQLSSGNQYKSLNVIRLSFYQNLDLRRN